MRCVTMNEYIRTTCVPMNEYIRTAYASDGYQVVLMWDVVRMYGVALLSRLLKIIGLFCKRALQKRRYVFLLCLWGT